MKLKMIAPFPYIILINKMAGMIRTHDQNLSALNRKTTEKIKGNRMLETISPETSEMIASAT